jgi:hypothetical protein
VNKHEEWESLKLAAVREMNQQRNQLRAFSPAGSVLGAIGGGLAGAHPLQGLSVPPGISSAAWKAAPAGTWVRFNMPKRASCWEWAPGLLTGAVDFAIGLGLVCGAVAYAWLLIGGL